MNNQLDRINEFICSIPESKFLKKGTLILSPDAFSNGGDNGTCNNYVAITCGAEDVTNSDCTNHNGICGLSSNTNCTNLPSSGESYPDLS